MIRTLFCLLGISLTIVVIFIGNCIDMEARMVKKPTDLKDGGDSIYSTYAGSAKITSIKQTSASIAQSKAIGGSQYEGYEVWFRFIPKSDVLHEGIKTIIAREHLFTLKNGWYVGPSYLEKYGIKVGEVYPCTLSILDIGTSTPVVFDFETIDTTDYFETQQ